MPGVPTDTRRGGTGPASINSSECLRVRYRSGHVPLGDFRRLGPPVLVVFYEVRSEGPSGCLGCLSAMGCLVAGAVSVGLAIVTIWGDPIPQSELSLYGKWIALSIVVAMAVFCWFSRTVRIVVMPDGLAVTRTVLRVLSLRTF